MTIFQNHDDVRHFASQRIVPERKTRIILGSGIAAGSFDPAQVPEKDRALLRNELGFQDGEIVVTMISRVIRSKGIPEFMSAAQIVESYFSNVRFLLVGPEDQESIDRLREDELDRLKQVVTYPGPRRDIPTVLAISDIFVLPSAYREGIPRVLLEAASMGLPLITTDSPGCREVVEDGVNGFLMSVGDITGLSQMIIKLIEQPGLRRRFGQASHQRMLERFELSIVAAQTRSIYQQLLAGTNRMIA
jgi:glycosyltransferase involved in cell wall biosynthesis